MEKSKASSKTCSRSTAQCFKLGSFILLMEKQIKLSSRLAKSNGICIRTTTVELSHQAETYSY